MGGQKLTVVLEPDDPPAVPLLLPAPPVVLFPPAPAPEVPLPAGKGAPPTEEEELLEPAPAPPVELDPASEPPVAVGAKVVVYEEPEPSVVVTTDPPATPARPPLPDPDERVEVVLAPVATTTVPVPPATVEVAVPPAILA